MIRLSEEYVDIVKGTRKRRLMLLASACCFKNNHIECVCVCAFRRRYSWFPRRPQSVNSHLVWILICKHHLFACSKTKRFETLIDSIYRVLTFFSISQRTPTKIFMCFILFRFVFVWIFFFLFFGCFTKMDKRCIFSDGYLISNCYGLTGLDLSQIHIRFDDRKIYISTKIETHWKSIVRSFVRTFVCSFVHFICLCAFFYIVFVLCF